jgi:hypothetical protein
VSLCGGQVINLISDNYPLNDLLIVLPVREGDGNVEGEGRGGQLNLLYYMATATKRSFTQRLCHL